MLVAHHASPIEHRQRGQAAKLEEFDLLSVTVGDFVAGVEQVVERQVFLLTLIPYGRRIIRPNDDDHGVAGGELSVILT